MSVAVYPVDIDKLQIERTARLVSVGDAAGEIVLANNFVTLLFGYLPNELVGLPVDVMVPPGRRDAHRSHRLRWIKSPCELAMGERMDLMGCRKDGVLFPIRVHLIPWVDRGTLYAVAMIWPVADRPAHGGTGPVALPISPAG